MYVCMFACTYSCTRVCIFANHMWTTLRICVSYIYTDLGMSGAYASLFACLVLCVFLWIFSSFVNFSIFCIDMVKRRKMLKTTFVCQSHWSFGCITAPNPAGTLHSPARSAPTRITLFSLAQFTRICWKTDDWWEGARSHKAKHGASAAFWNPRASRLRRISWVIISKNWTQTSPFHMCDFLFVCIMCKVPAYSLLSSLTSWSPSCPSPNDMKAGPSSPSAQLIVVVVRGLRHPWHVTEVPYAPSWVSLDSHKSFLSFFVPAHNGGVKNQHGMLQMLCPLIFVNGSYTSYISCIYIYIYTQILIDWCSYIFIGHLKG